MEQGNKRGEAMLYYLFMMADGKITSGEEEIFSNICKELFISDEEKAEIIEECVRLSSAETDIFDVIIQEEIDEKAGQGWYGVEKNDTGKARVIWNLLNLGYSDKDYSENEKKIVSYLVEKWSVARSIFMEMKDTADTMLALLRQKEWASKTFADSFEKEKQLDMDIKELLTDIKLTISEIGL